MLSENSCGGCKGINRCTPSFDPVDCVCGRRPESPPCSALRGGSLLNALPIAGRVFLGPDRVEFASLNLSDRQPRDELARLPSRIPQPQNAAEPSLVLEIQQKSGLIIYALRRIWKQFSAGNPKFLEAPSVRVALSGWQVPAARACRSNRCARRGDSASFPASRRGELAPTAARSPAVPASARAALRVATFASDLLRLARSPAKNGRFSGLLPALTPVCGRRYNRTLVVRESVRPGRGFGGLAASCYRTTSLPGAFTERNCDGHDACKGNPG
jgi:hypothetical protein